MRQVLIHRGQVSVEDVPAPLVEAGHVLVEVAYSLISAGTEVAGVNQSRKSLIQRVIEKPERIQKVLDHLKTQGIQKTVAKVQSTVDQSSPSGYSCSGIVVQVGADVTGFSPGDLVACAGAGIANHAEIVLVPKNLLVKLPEDCTLRDGASVTLGAIAMQGVRRADPRLGEIVTVIGLGLLGQLTVQILKAAGCRVVGLDLDSRRTELAKVLGADIAFTPATVDVNNQIRHLTSDHGVDATIITAASHSDAIVAQAMEITRKKGRVVVVGDVGLGLQRSPFYEKEIDFLISCSYGPGRYDERYEEKGLDYPYAYIRWTENRNMQEYVRLVAEGKIKLDQILEREYDISQAAEAYAALENTEAKPLGILLCYPLSDSLAQTHKLKTKHSLRSTPVVGKVRIAVIGAGGFAKSTHLPNLRKLTELYHIRAIVSNTGSNAKSTAQQFGADYASTRYQDVLEDPDVDAVLISTRHHLHAQQAIQAVQAGKAVFLEKPLAINQWELDEVSTAIRERQVPFMVGFNRRFSPAAQSIKRLISQRHNPFMCIYRLNAGYLPPTHWTQTEEGGGRIIGEACHIIDLFNFLTDSTVRTVSSTPIRPTSSHILAGDNVSITLGYEDGSVATLIYTSLGSNSWDKEYMELYCDGSIYVLKDYFAVLTSGSSKPIWTSSQQDKGHLAQLRVFSDLIQGQSTTIPSLDSLIETTEITLGVALDLVS